MSRLRFVGNEFETYAGIFRELAGGGLYLTGAQAAPIFRRGGLSDGDLEAVWEVADIDSDGNLDVEEFCIAMKLMYSYINGDLSSMPKTVPHALVPDSKMHLVIAQDALSGRQSAFTYGDEDDEDDLAELKDGFDWYISPSNRTKYEQVYSAHSGNHGDVSYDKFQPLFKTLGIPDTDIKSAWNLINPNFDNSIPKDQALLFIHILSSRVNGFRIPRFVPPHLRNTFSRSQIDYNVERVKSNSSQGQGQGGQDSRRARFGDDENNNNSNNSSSSVQTDPEFEEAELKTQLRNLQAKLRSAEADATKRRESGNDNSANTAAIVKRELELLLDYKRNELRDVEAGKGKYAPRDVAAGNNTIADDIQSVQDQVNLLADHLKQRDEILARLKSEIAAERV